ncbi:hypothetical protein MRB53_041638 [Persea americana]|nr:hypothetical protein MRB53_041638 [Persea americana]
MVTLVAKVSRLRCVERADWEGGKAREGPATRESGGARRCQGKHEPIAVLLRGHVAREHTTGVPAGKQSCSDCADGSFKKTSSVSCPSKRPVARRENSSVRCREMNVPGVCRDEGSEGERSSGLKQQSSLEHTQRAKECDGGAASDVGPLSINPKRD